METAACAVGITVLLSESSVSLKQCGELRCGTVSPHGPGETKYPTSLMIIRVSLSGLVKKLLRPVFRDARSSDESTNVETLVLKMI